MRHEHPVARRYIQRADSSARLRPNAALQCHGNPGRHRPVSGRKLPVRTPDLRLDSVVTGWKSCSRLLMERNIDKPMGLRRLASEAGLSLRHMERVFRDHADVTPARYYLNLRLDRARGLITQTALQVLDVAVACGFGSPEHSSRVYRQRFGITPRDDRNMGPSPISSAPCRYTQAFRKGIRADIATGQLRGWSNLACAAARAGFGSRTASRRGWLVLPMSEVAVISGPANQRPGCYAREPLNESDGRAGAFALAGQGARSVARNPMGRNCEQYQTNGSLRFGRDDRMVE